MRREVGMKKLLQILIALGAIAVLLSSCGSSLKSCRVWAAEEWKWQHFGADPYAKTRTEAMQTRESAFRAMGLSAPVITEFLRATEKSGEKIRLVNGDHLSVMLSKGSIVHRDVVVAFTRPPISGRMEYAAPAEKWQISLEGKIYSVVLPEICYNWSYNWMPAPPPPPPTPAKATPPLPERVLKTVVNCVEISFDALIGGRARWGVASNHGPLPPSICNAQRQDNGRWTAWTGECPDCVPGNWGTIHEVLGEKAEVPHKYLYSVTSERQTLRFSEDIWEDGVYVCLEYPDGTRTRGVYIWPQDWKEHHRFFIPDRFWERSDGSR